MSMIYYCISPVYIDEVFQEILRGLLHRGSDAGGLERFGVKTEGVWLNTFDVVSFHHDSSRHRQ
jgi:hypothetical protein